MYTGPCGGPARYQGVHASEAVLLALITVVSVAAGAELVYFALAEDYDVASWAAGFLALGLLSGRLLWP